MKTLEKFAGAKRHNYCTLPSIDVEILPDVHYCRHCGELLEYVPHPKGPGWGSGNWQHVSSSAEDHSRAACVTPRTRCRYCHSQEAVYRQHAWHDAVECDRCGAVEGYAIGD
jgi:hypothetical protein